ncbi:MAG: hypothetical protein Tsb008_18090 [Rhodothalassiaceae bacterium]
MGDTRDEIDRFIERALAAGHDRAAIKGALREAGWPEREIAAALAGWAEADFPLPVPRPRYRASARDGFFYLLLFTSLYVCAIALGTILFQLVNLGIPDAVAGDPYRIAVFDNIRWGIAGLIVFLPAWLWAERVTGRLRERLPAHAKSGVRRWLTWLTLFVAATIMLGDFMTLLIAFLKGELVLRLILKGLIVALIAGAVFWRYYSEQREDAVLSGEPQ